MQRQMEFLLEWQAQFAAKLGELEDNLARQGKAIERVNKAVEQQAENIERLGENVERVVGIVERVVDTVAHLAQVTTERFEAADKRADETDRKIAALVDAQIRNEEMVRKLGERIDKLTAVVEGHTADGHGGRAEPEG